MPATERKPVAVRRKLWITRPLPRGGQLLPAPRIHVEEEDISARVDQQILAVGRPLDGRFLHPAVLERGWLFRRRFGRGGLELLHRGKPLAAARGGIVEPDFGALGIYEALTVRRPDRWARCWFGLRRKGFQRHRLLPGRDSPRNNQEQRSTNGHSDASRHLIAIVASIDFEHGDPAGAVEQAQPGV